MQSGERLGGSHAKGGDLVPSMPACVCPKVKDIGPFFGFKVVK